MLFRPITLSSVLFIAACCANITAHAQKTGFFLGGAAGRLDYNIDTSPQATGGLTVTGKDEKDTGWKVFGGYQFNKYIGAEASYVDLGKFSANGTARGLPFSVRVKTDGFGLALVGTLPLNDNIAFFGKVGGVRTKSKSTGSVTNAILSDNDHHNGSLVGVGIRYNFRSQVAIRLEAERFALGDGDSAIFYSLGAQYTF